METSDTLGQDLRRVDDDLIVDGERFNIEPYDLISKVDRAAEGAWRRSEQAKKKDNENKDEVSRTKEELDDRVHPEVHDGGL